MSELPGINSGQSDEAYFAARAAVERQLWETASDPSMALIHRQLADRYELLAAGLNQPRPPLHIVE